MRPFVVVVVCGVLAAAAGVVFADEVLPEGDRDPFVLDWWSMDSGGGPSAGGDFVLLGTLGQPDAGNAVGGDFVLLGGFLAGGDPLFIFADDFESGDTSAWSAEVGGSEHGGGE